MSYDKNSLKNVTHRIKDNTDRTKHITNYGKLLAEIQFFESIDNEFQVERLSKLLEAARKRDYEELKHQNTELN